MGEQNISLQDRVKIIFEMEEVSITSVLINTFYEESYFRINKFEFVESRIQSILSVKKKCYGSAFFFLSSRCSNSGV